MQADLSLEKSDNMAPLIPPSSEFFAQEDRLLKCSQLETSMITDYVSTLQNGQLTNLRYPPVENKDAATVQYVNNTTFAGGIAGSVQYNYNSVFGGSPNLLFDGSSLTINGTYTDSIFSIYNTSIDNLNNPVNQLDIATKDYVDRFSKKLTETTLNSDTSQVYAAQYMVNGIILRNSVTLSNVTLIDFTDSAANILLKYPGTVVGSVVYFTLQNANTSSVKISLRPGSGVSFISAASSPISSVLIEPNYTLHSRIIVTNKTYGTQAVSINIDSISYTMAYMSPFFVRSQEPRPTNYNAYLATTTDIPLFDFQTVDSVVTSLNDRVLVKDQTSSTENGIYVVSNGLWSRALDLASGSNAFNINVYISNGLTNADLIFTSEPFIQPLIVGAYGLSFSSSPTSMNTVSSLTSSLPYKASNVFFEPFIQIQNVSETSLNYVYSATDLKNSIVIRNPPSDSSDTFEDFLENNQLFHAGSFTIQNISSNKIVLGPSSNWTYVPSLITINPTTSGLFWVNITESDQVLNSIGLLSIN